MVNLGEGTPAINKRDYNHGKKKLRGRGGGHGNHRTADYGGGHIISHVYVMDTTAKEGDKAIIGDAPGHAGLIGHLMGRYSYRETCTDGKVKDFCDHDPTTKQIKRIVTNKKTFSGPVTVPTVTVVVSIPTTLISHLTNTHNDPAVDA